MLNYFSFIRACTVLVEAVKYLLFFTLRICLKVWLKHFGDAWFESVLRQWYIFPYLLYTLMLCLLRLGFRCFTWRVVLLSVSCSNFLGRSCFDLDITIFTKRDDPFFFFKVFVPFKFVLEVYFEVNGGLQDLNQLSHVYFLVVRWKYLIDVQLCLSAKLISNHVLHVPVLDKRVFVLFFKFLKGSLKPWKPSPSIFKVRVWLAWFKDFKVWSQEVVAKPHFYVADCCWS